MNGAWVNVFTEIFHFEKETLMEAGYLSCDTVLADGSAAPLCARFFDEERQLACVE